MSVYIIAEIGINHNGEMKLARRLIREAKKSGADAVKFQLYDPRKLFADEPALLSEALKCSLSYDQWSMLVRSARELGIDISASVFDLERFQWLKEIKPPWYKIASRTFKDTGFIKSIIGEARLTYISLGMYDPGDRNESILFKDYSKRNVRFLQCISEYPARLKTGHLRAWESMQNHRCRYFGDNKIAGYSDHNIGIETSLWAIAHGAKVIEKHFTLDKRMKGSDHICSMTPEELKVLRALAPGLEDLALKQLRV